MFNYSSKEQRKFEEKLYSKVVEEIENNEINKGLWAKALANSDYNDNKTRALYIKYRVQKLKDEISEEQETKKQQQRIREHTKAKKEKDDKNIDRLNAAVEKTVSTFNLLILLLVLMSVIVLIFGYILYDSDNGYWVLWCLASVFLLCMVFWLYLLGRKIKSSDDLKWIKSRLNIVFSIFIPLTFAGMFIGLFSPIIGLVSFFAFFTLAVQAIKFNLAFIYSRKNNLI